MEEHKNTKYLGADEQISLDDLKSFLWGAATRLRTDRRSRVQRIHFPVAVLQTHQRCL